MVSPRKEFFKEPIVRVNTTGIKFPKICPICGSNATNAIRVSTIPSRKRWLRPQWDPMFWSGTRRFGRFPSQNQAFRVPVCEEHHYVGENEWRHRSVCIIVDGILIFVLYIALLTMGSSFWLGRASPFWVYHVLAAFVVAIVLSYLTFRSNPFESAFRIVGFDAALQHIWLQLKNPEYRDAFLNENPMNSELVSWIVKQ
ncbi:MAG: hypothetical protein RTU09_06885 [Candidatus Thorarchaeota archaeon]